MKSFESYNIIAHIGKEGLSFIVHFLKISCF